MRICVTGAAGFIGSALVKQLVAQRHEVVAITRAQGNNEVGDAGSVHWVQWDMNDLPSPLRAIENIDFLVHLAGRAHIHQNASASLLADLRRSNVDGAVRAVQAATMSGARRVVFVSTIGVHGSALSGPAPVTEESAVDPLEAYALSKWEAEEQLLRMSAEDGFELVVLRPALVAGGGAPGNLARLARLVSAGVPLPVPREDNARSFIGLKNLAKIIVACLDHPRAAGETFVVAEPEWPSTREVLEHIGEGMGQSVRMMRIPANAMRTAARLLGKAALYEKVFGDLRVDASKLHESLGWRPTQPLTEALRDVGRGVRNSKKAIT